ALIDLVSDGVFVGQGWYPLEAFGGEVFRWVANDAELVIGGSDEGLARSVLQLVIEPGPGLGMRAFILQVRDEQQRVIATPRIDGRTCIELPLQVAPYNLVL